MIAAGSYASRADFLAGGGEMAARIRSFDWAGTPLGPIENWPQSLKTSVSLILSSRHPMWIGWGPEMTFLYNDAYLHVLGPAKHPGALGRPASKVWAEIWDVCGPLADKVFVSGEATFVDDVRLFMDRGDFLEETFYSFSYSPIRDESGAVSGLFCPSTDVTPKVLNTRRLSTLSELAASSLLEKTTAGACVTAGRILAKNPDDIPFALLYLADAGEQRAMLEQAVGPFEGALAESIDLTNSSAECPWPVAEVFRTSERSVVSTAGIPGLPLGVARQSVRQALVLPVTSRGEHTPYGVLVAGVNPGRPLDADHLTFFDLVAGQVATAIQNARAVEEEKKRADMLAQIDRAKTVFFSNVSHEFRTPLTLMLGPIEHLLSKMDGTRPEEREQLDIAHRNSLRLLKLVNSLLDFSRLEAGRLKASYAPTDLAALTRDLASNFRSAIEAAGLNFTVDCQPLPQPVYVDVEMWERVVLNLLSNAFKFTFEGQITVTLQEEDGCAVLRVCDTGTGIPQNELPRIFERFHRVEGARGRTFEGTGIGLALIQEYVKLHGGEIAVQSREGEGSTFTVRLPLGVDHLPAERIARDAQGTGAVALHAEPFASEVSSWATDRRLEEQSPNGENKIPAATEKPRIVLADDNADMREHVTRILGPDYEIATARDGREALEIIRENPPDLVLSDIMMPGMNGFELLRALRNETETRTVPVIFLSARAGEEKRVEGLQAGADDYVVKPFTADELRARVGTHVRMARLRRAAMEREIELRHEAEAARDQAVSVLENITDGFIGMDSQWRVTYANAEAERLNGMRREDMLGKDHWELFPGAVGTTVHNELLRAVAERVPVEFENYYKPWGRWFHVKAYPGADGGVSVFFEDITARKSAERLLRESEERFRAIVETMPQCLKVVGADGTLLQMNSSGLAFVEASGADEVIGKSVYDLIAPEFRDAYRAFHQRVCSGQKGNMEFEIIGLKGGRRQMETHAAALPGPDGAMAQLAITHDITDRKERERASLLLAAIVDSSDDAIISKDLNGIIMSWNKSAERVFGYTAEEAVGKSITMLIPQDRQDEEPHILSRLRRGERVDHFETIRRKKDGTLLDISLTISPVRNSEGVIIGASKIARDITDRKRIEKAVQALNAQLTADLSAVTRMQQVSTRLVQAEDFPQLLGEIVDAGIEITGADMGNIQLLENKALKTVCHRGFEEGSLESLDQVHDGDAPIHTALAAPERVVVEDVASSPIFSPSERGAMLKAGAVAVQSTPLVSRAGEVLGRFSTYYRDPRRPGERELRLLDVLARQAADLIERKRAEAALLASEGKFRQLADAMPQIVWTAGADGTVDYFNERWFKFTGFGHEEFGDAAWQQLLHPEDVRRSVEAWHAALEGGQPYRIEHRFWDRMEKRWRWFMSRAAAVRDDNGEIVKWFGTSTDIDEQKRVEDQLRRANHDLEQFAYSASHDLQEPLRSIKIYGELLAKRYGNKLDGQAFEFLEYLKAGASRMELLIRDLLAYTQVTKLDVPAAATDANEALEASLANLSGAIAESGAKVTHDPLPAIPVHSTHLRQLFQNLIGNAIKYRHPERLPEVHVASERQDGAWMISVRDNGIGIERSYREQIFGLFKRLHTNDEYSGTGIGLAICQRIVERYHGRIWVESEPGQGSKFIFTVPA